MYLLKVGEVSNTLRDLGGLGSSVYPCNVAADARESSEDSRLFYKTY